MVVGPAATLSPAHASGHEKTMSARPDLTCPPARISCWPLTAHPDRGRTEAHSPRLSDSASAARHKGTSRRQRQIRLLDRGRAGDALGAGRVRGQCPTPQVTGGGGTERWDYGTGLILFDRAPPVAIAPSPIVALPVCGETW